MTDPLRHLAERLGDQTAVIGVIGLGYAGLPRGEGATGDWYCCEF